MAPTRARIIVAVHGDNHDGDRPQAAIPWWSFSKVAIAMAALRLVSDGKLDLDRAVDTHPFTLRHLLQHRSGLPDYGGLPEYHEAVRSGDEVWSRATVLARSSASSLLFAPGDGWSYSNIGYLWVREEIEKSTGLPLADVLRELVFHPLSISNVKLAQTPADLDATAWGNAARYDPRWVFHGLLVGPAAAAAALLHQLLAGEFLPADLLDEMRTAYELGRPAPDRPWRSGGYGLGLMIGRGDPSGRYLGHTGEGPGSVAAVYAKLDEGDRPGISRTVAVFGRDAAMGEVESFAFVAASGARDR